MNELIKEDKPKTLKLGGKSYKLSPLNLNVMASIEDEFDCSIDKVGELLDKKRASALRKLIFIFLKDNYPELTITEVGKNIDVNNLKEVSETIAKSLTGE